MYVQILKKVELYRSYIKHLNEIEDDDDDIISCSDMDTLIGPMSILEE